MKDFNYKMPTELYFGRDIILNKKELFKRYSGKAFIITGKGSSKKNGSLDDVIKALEYCKIEYVIFDEVEENPSLETVEKAADIGKREGVSFIIGIGGGSPIDAAKAIGILINNHEYDAYSVLTAPPLKSIPLIAVSTTAGTGTEVTQYSIVTDNAAKTKKNLGQSVFADIAFLDAKYMENMPYDVTVSTAVDAFSHLAEAYLNTNANLLSDTYAERGIRLFAQCLKALINENINYEIREKLLWVSTLGGMAIAQVGTSLPHGMGYPLTYFKGVPHGKANCVLYREYFKIFKDKTKVNNIIDMLNLKSIDELGDILDNLLKVKVNISEEEIKEYTESMVSNKAKLKNHPEDVKKEEVFNIYYKSLVK
ncbi:alcohol dehydrogenase [Clostridium amylolyticum]|uniref:Alcohol dehydrogenase n=1 Tax=Clostridium amylolyticum TaxID=1121298 RepID=A0A1M6NCU8_9CLOT|nr:iron-containing alcohol dehydrogenase family protein [Clostridium amylolyticum]SHJ93568.1 alcohol dehydrogenase [Clostridium amylolyticum]